MATWLLMVGVLVIGALIAAGYYFAAYYRAIRHEADLQELRRFRASNQHRIDQTVQDTVAQMFETIRRQG